MLRRLLLSLFAMYSISALPAFATDYDIGPGKPFTSLGAFPFENLQAGDTVNIHYRAEPYREKIRVRAQGTPADPVIIRGVPGPGGERPVLDGINATTRSTDVYSFEPLQDLGLIILYRGNNDPYGYKPHDIVFEGLELRNGGMGAGNTFTDANGNTRSWEVNASGIWSLGVENIVFRDLAIHDCGNGLFMVSRGDEQTQSRNILVERCEIYDNSVPGRFFEHNVYTEAQNITFQYNYFGPVKAGALGGNIKDRSARTIVRYNWIQGGQRLIDLVEAQDSFPFVGSLPEYGDDYVYGNILSTNPGDAQSLVHYGGDSGVDNTYRKGTLHFYHNTIRIRRDVAELYRTHIFDLTSNEQAVDARNNIFYVAPFTPGGTPTNLQVLITAGTANFGVNWASPGWQLWRDGTPPVGVATGTDNLFGGPANDPGFVDSAADDLRLVAQSPSIDEGGPLHPDASASFPVQSQYLSLSNGQPRVTVGAAADLGAYEFGAIAEGEGEGEGEGSNSHSGDQDNDGRIILSEVLRIIQFFNSAGFHCEPANLEDGFATGPGDTSCTPHSADYQQPPNFDISLSELLRVIQIFNSVGYFPCPGSGTEDGFCIVS